MIDNSFWKNKKVFLTGHTGFKGSWMSLWLQSLGSNVCGYAFEPPTKPSLFNEANVGQGMSSVIGDIRDYQKLFKSLKVFQPDIVIHMAAQPLVRLSYDEPVDTYSTNVMGTVNLLDCVRKLDSVKAVVNVTSDKCYQNREWYWGYREDEPKGGYDPYSNSKACAELVTEAFRNSFFNIDQYSEHQCGLASARAGNVIGGGDWAKDRLIPDILTAFEQAQKVEIRNPDSIRPWQHVLEPLSGYLLLAQKLFVDGASYSDGWNFGPSEDDVKTVEWIVRHMSDAWGGGDNWFTSDSSHPHEATYLKLDCSKAKTELGWHPRWTLEKTLESIILWHKAWIGGQCMYQHCINEIENYVTSQNS